MTVAGVNLDDDLIEWADEHHRDLGFRSRSALINGLLRMKREEYQEAHADE